MNYISLSTISSDLSLILAKGCQRVVTCLIYPADGNHSSRPKQRWELIYCYHCRHRFCLLVRSYSDIFLILINFMWGYNPWAIVTLSNSSAAPLGNDGTRWKEFEIRGFPAIGAKWCKRPLLFVLLVFPFLVEMMILQTLKPALFLCDLMKWSHIISSCTDEGVWIYRFVMQLLQKLVRI